jgi:hypothetical protein
VATGGVAVQAGPSQAGSAAAAVPVVWGGVPASASGCGVLRRNVPPARMPSALTPRTGLGSLVRSGFLGRRGHRLPVPAVGVDAWPVVPVCRGDPLRVGQLHASVGSRRSSRDPCCLRRSPGICGTRAACREWRPVDALERPEHRGVQVSRRRRIGKWGWDGQRRPNPTWMLNGRRCRIRPRSAHGFRPWPGHG